MTNVNKDKLDKASKIQEEIINKISDLERLDKDFSQQERTLFGGWVFLSRNTWTSIDTNIFGGDIYNIYVVIRRAFDLISRQIQQIENRIGSPDNRLENIIAAKKKNNNKIIN